MTPTYRDAAKAGLTDKRPPIETFEYQFPDTAVTLEITVDEFTSICPKTGHPDFGTIEIEYQPNKLCFELKSLKLYFQSFRNCGVFYEHGTVIMLRDLVDAVEPAYLEIRTKFRSRGGLRSESRAEYWEGDGRWPFLDGTEEHAEPPPQHPFDAGCLATTDGRRPDNESIRPPAPPLTEAQIEQGKAAMQMRREPAFRVAHGTEQEES